ncbi:hypothetical protein LTR66_013558 [Elasticomyces elasticus]|nr:hypothetical protein LTR66_013558 [Elasticomyces elasticus]
MAFQQPPQGMPPGMAHTHPGMPPTGPSMQMHPGVSGPGGPHVSQAQAMMGIQPGPQGMGSQGPGGGMGIPAGIGGQGHNAMALSHLTPQQQIMHQHAQHQQQLQAASVAMSARFPRSEN